MANSMACSLQSHMNSDELLQLVVYWIFSNKLRQINTRHTNWHSYIIIKKTHPTHPNKILLASDLSMRRIEGVAAHLNIRQAMF